MVSGGASSLVWASVCFLKRVLPSVHWGIDGAWGKGEACPCSWGGASGCWRLGNQRPLKSFHRPVTPNCLLCPSFTPTKQSLTLSSALCRIVCSSDYVATRSLSLAAGTQVPSLCPVTRPPAVCWWKWAGVVFRQWQFELVNANLRGCSGYCGV